MPRQAVHRGGGGGQAKLLPGARAAVPSCLPVFQRQRLPRPHAACPMQTAVYAIFSADCDDEQAPQDAYGEKSQPS